jgi:hypothetical protein
MPSVLRPAALAKAVADATGVNLGVVHAAMNDGLGADDYERARPDDPARG